MTVYALDRCARCGAAVAVRKRGANGRWVYDFYCDACRATLVAGLPQVTLRPTGVAAALTAARAYRAAEQDGTPRLWRGKALQDLANALDDALEAVG